MVGARIVISEESEESRHTSSAPAGTVSHWLIYRWREVITVLFSDRNKPNCFINTCSVNVLYNTHNLQAASRDLGCPADARMAKTTSWLGYSTLHETGICLFKAISLSENCWSQRPTYRLHQMVLKYVYTEYVAFWGTKCGSFCFDRKRKDYNICNEIGRKIRSYPSVKSGGGRLTGPRLRVPRQSKGL